MKLYCNTMLCCKVWSQSEHEAGKEALSKALEEERHQSEATNEELKV